jgi:hypothetical protein
MHEMPPPLAFLAPKLSTHHIFIYTLPKLTWTSLMSQPFGTYEHNLHSSIFSWEIFMLLVATSIYINEKKHSGLIRSFGFN